MYVLNNWQIMNTLNLSSLESPPVSVTKQIKCLSDSNNQIFGFEGISATGYKTVYYFNFTV